MTASPSPVSATPWLTLSIRLMAGGFLLFFGLALPRCSCGSTSRCSTPTPGACCSAWFAGATSKAADSTMS